MQFFDEMKAPGLSHTWARFGGELDFYTGFVFTEGTMQQLKNSGGLRLIDDKQVLDSIVSYDLFTKDVNFKLENVHQAQLVVESMNNSVFDLQKIYREAAKDDSTAKYVNNEFILTTDRAVLGKFYNEILRFKFICKNYLRALQKAQIKSAALIKYLKETYSFD